MLASFAARWNGERILKERLPYVLVFRRLRHPDELSEEGSELPFAGSSGFCGMERPRSVANCSDVKRANFSGGTLARSSGVKLRSQAKISSRAVLRSANADVRADWK